MKKHTIVKTIRLIYLAKLIPALLFILFTVIVFFQFPFMELLFPKHVEDTNTIFEEYSQGNEFLEINVPTLYYTGYDYTKNSVIKGSYYYAFINDKCVFFLLGNQTTNNGAKQLNNITINSKLITDAKQRNYIIEHFSNDLNWTDADLTSMSADFIVSELNTFALSTYALLGIMGIVDIYALVSLIVSILFILAPHLSPICKHLGKGKASKLALKEVDMELKNDRFFYVSDMSITSHYFIELDKYHAKIIPLKNIIWAYKYSKMNKIIGISYTLVIYSNNSVSKFPHKQKYDIDFILDYLNESCPNVIIGNSKENRILAMEQFKK